MTNNQLTRERLAKIKSWRETYGAGSNVMLPAEEAEELARIALAAMDSEPVFTLEVSQADYKGQKLGNHFGFITLDAARKLKEGNYQLYLHAQPDASHLSRICAESYQVVGALAEALRVFNDVSVIKALDNLAAQELIHDDVLPFSIPEAAQPAPASMKDHQIRELVNELRDIAIEYHGTQQLRERISRTVRAAMLASATQEEKS